MLYQLVSSVVPSHLLVLFIFTVLSESVSVTVEGDNTNEAAISEVEDINHNDKETNSDNVESIFLTIVNMKPPSEITEDSDEVKS